MTVPVPKHLDKLSKNICVSNNSTNFYLTCDNCQSDEFELFINNHQSKEEKVSMKWLNDFEKYRIENKWKNYVSYIDDNGKRYFAKLNFFGKKVDKYYIGDMPNLFEINIIKIRCFECGTEHIVFDNRLHGSNALGNIKNMISYDNIVFKKKTVKNSINGQYQIMVKVINESSISDFNEKHGQEYSNEIYSDSYSEIIFYGMLKKQDRKKTILFSEETE